MNLLQLVLKQMRQRALGTWLTLLSVLLGVALATAVLVFQREGERLFLQADFGYDVLVGPVRGSPLQLTLNSIYNLDVSPGLLDYGVYKDLTDRKNRAAVRIAVPIAKGDTYKSLPIIGTVPRMFNYTNDDSEAGPQPIPSDYAPFQYRLDRSYELASGKMFHPRKFEAIIGSEITDRTGLKLGDTFKATHGNPKPDETPDIHDQLWTVVGTLKRTGTAADRALYIPLVSFLAISEHEETLQKLNQLEQGVDISKLASPHPNPSSNASTSSPSSTSTHPATEPSHDADHDHEGPPKFHLDDKGLIVLDLPEDEWKLSAIFVKARSFPLATQLMYQLNFTNKASASNPAQTMRDFFGVFLRPSTQVLLAVAAMVSVVAGVGILVAIYNSVSARLREIAILRALGATRARILTLICTEAGLIGLVGSVGGLVTGHLMVYAGKSFVPDNLGELNALSVSRTELLYLGLVVLISVLAGLVPALKAYKVPVATNLSA